MKLRFTRRATQDLADIADYMMAAPITSAGRFSSAVLCTKGGLPPKPSGNLEWLEGLEIYT
jgi:hypothetical protein